MARAPEMTAFGFFESYSPLFAAPDAAACDLLPSGGAVLHPVGEQAHFCFERTQPRFGREGALAPIGDVGLGLGRIHGLGAQPGRRVSQNIGGGAKMAQAHRMSRFADDVGQVTEE